MRTPQRHLSQSTFVQAYAASLFGLVVFTLATLLIGAKAGGALDGVVEGVVAVVGAEVVAEVGGIGGRVSPMLGRSIIVGPQCYQRID